MSADLYELVRRVVKAPPNWKCEQERWVPVSKVFQLGSISAKALCRRFDLDPEDRKPRKKK